VTKFKTFKLFNRSTPFNGLNDLNPLNVSNAPRLRLVATFLFNPFEKTVIDKFR
jgi:hypothetical protein